MASSERVYFRLMQDEDGYPPVAVETLWATRGTNDVEYVIDSVPFFARDATIGDTVPVHEEEGCLWFERLVRPSRNSLIRIVFFDRMCVERVNANLVAQGCSTEYLRDHGLLAVNIPDSVNLAKVQGYLQAEAITGSIDYEEPILRQ